MRKVQPSLSSLILVIAFTFLSIAGHAYAQANSAVQIDTLKFVGTTLTISGRNFGASAPSVQVGQAAAAVSSNTDSEIVAEVPSLSTGTYMVKVVRDQSQGGTAVSSLRIQ